MLNQHLKRLTRTAARMEREHQYQGAAYKWRKARLATRNNDNRAFYDARERWCWKQHGERQQQREMAA